ncbi:MAG: multidrug ABC transporter ATP-binding protein [Gammaproteobacteria bacterium]|nr:multidrug ABC transporter ATP-binding protein [Gammaproteobacteria bacterium]MCH2616398.1 ABC transporter ATP-binding protein/permease [Acidimicrobiales bacterium]MED5446434.1 ABC transporter ATP-binding protein [Actinomycetota bacterium]
MSQSRHSRRNTRGEISSQKSEAVSLGEGEDEEKTGALIVLKRGLQVSPELRTGAGLTVLMALIVAAGSLAIPVLIQQILDQGLRGEDGLRSNFIYISCAIAFIIVSFVIFAQRATYNRLVRVAETTILELRVRVFRHLHRLSLADHQEARKGILTARVTSDIETLSQFAQWGAIAWIVDSVIIVGTLTVMAIYSWQLTLVVIAIYLPIIPILKAIQQQQFLKYREVREAVSETLGQASEAVTAAPVIRSYGYQSSIRSKLEMANQNQYRRQIKAHKFFALLAPVMDTFSALSIAGVIVAGSYLGPDMGLTSGEMIAFVFLTTILIAPIWELGEVLDQTQTALAGWWKILSVLDVPIEVNEPESGEKLRPGAVEIEASNVNFRYRTGSQVLDDISICIPAGTNVAVVGETGSGKTTFVKLLARIADPTNGQITINGVPIHEIDADSRHTSIQMVPQDGFLFDQTIRENVAFGKPNASEEEIQTAFQSLGLTDWLNKLPEGINTQTGSRGERISVGERQLVALARAQLANPGLLILDEATSAVDPETEVALVSALERLSQGRTTISVAHRLSTAEKADLILVFDQGKIVETGTHQELSTQNGIYADLHNTWMGNTQAV